MLDGFPLSPKQVASIVESQTARMSVWHGAVRSGKTVASLVAFLIALAGAPRSGLVLATGRTLQSIERNLIDPLQDRALFGPLARQVHHTRGASTATILGRTVHLIGAADARAEGKLRGLTACLALVDEATLLPEEFVTQLMARLSVPGARLLVTTNPGPPGHWLRKRFLLRPDLDLRQWPFTLDDNPFLDPAYVANLKLELTGVWYRRMVLGEWVQAEGAVFPMFDSDRHVITGPLPTLVALPGVGVDYGTTNAFSAHLLGVQLADRATGTPARLVLAREYRHDPRLAQRQLTDAEFSVNLRTWIGADRPEWVCVDPSAASFKLQLWRDGLPNVVDARNDVIDSIRMAASLLSTDRLVIHEQCTGLIEEIPGYSWDEKASEQGEDKPVKTDDHSVDSGLRYAPFTTEAAWRRFIPDVIAA